MISLLVVVLSFALIISGLYLIVKMNSEGDVFKTYKHHTHPEVTKKPSDR